MCNICLWGGRPCDNPNCRNCVVKERESTTYPLHVVKSLMRKKTRDLEWNCQLEYACKCILFTSAIVKIMDSTDYPGYKESDAVDAIIEFRNMSWDEMYNDLRSKGNEDNN